MDSSDEDDLQLGGTLESEDYQLLGAIGGDFTFCDSELSCQTMDNTFEKCDKQLVEELVEEIQNKFRVKEYNPRIFPKRPNFLTIGKPLQLVTNHFLLTVGERKAFHYDIEIERVPKLGLRDTNIVDNNIEDFNRRDKIKNKFSRKMATKLNRKIFTKMIEFYSQNGNRLFEGINPIYDGQKNMFTSKILNGTENIRLTVTLDDEGRDSTFYVNIKLAETNEMIDLNILNEYHSGKTCDDEVVKKSILFINTLLRHNSTMNEVPIGQSIFSSKINGKKLSQSLLIAFGFYSSVRNLMIGPTLNVDRSASAFYNSEVDVVSCIINANLSHIPVLDESKRLKIKKELCGLQVEATHVMYGTHYRKYRILGITKESAKDIKFEWLDRDHHSGIITPRGRVSVSEYFSKKYGIKLKHPQLPCFELGNPNNVVKLPLEVCRLVSHQRVRRLMTNSERSEMTRISSSQKPSERLNECRDFVDKQFHSGVTAIKNSAFLSEFGIEVSKELLIVDSRVIEPPILKYRTGNVKPQNGEWLMSNSHFLKAEGLNNWILINMSLNICLNQNQNIDHFIVDLCRQALKMGMSAEKPLIIPPPIKSFTPKDSFDIIKKRIQNYPKLKMILFITPDKAHEYSDDIYSEIKLMGDVERGLTTQCLSLKSFIANSCDDKQEKRRKWKSSYLYNILLKINPKLGGTNVALLDNSCMPKIFKKESNLMIIGADVNHPAPADRISPSIAALVGSYDNEFSNYYTTVSMQPKSREEMIKNLDEMTFELLENYKNKSQNKKSLPQRIIFYRDGVSEGQFQHVIDNEYPLLTKAFSKMDAKYEPKLTFIVVQKRHHTRFMRADNRRNVPPGTVVEKDITHKTDFDFYLCSHAGRIGTSRSAHYYVLADENGFSSDDMCRMTYYLCHIYQRCTKSVSIPAPVYYADLAAYRAKVHASAYVGNGSNSSSLSTDAEEREIKTLSDKIKVVSHRKEKLYYC